MKKAYRSSRKFNAPDGVVPKGEYSSLDSLKTDFMAFRKSLLDFLQDMEGEKYDLVMYKHPFFGRLTLLQMLEFFEGHALRHGKQIDKIIAEFEPI